MIITTVGLDIAKQVIPIHAVDMHGKPVIRKQLRTCLEKEEAVKPNDRRGGACKHPRKRIVDAILYSLLTWQPNTVHFGKMGLLEIERVDVRKWAPSAHHALRRIAVRLFKRGPSISAIARDLGLRRPTVADWVGRLPQGRSLADRPNGRALGSGRRLTAEQEARIRRDLVDKTPDQIKLRFALWTGWALIKDYFGVDLPARTVRWYLARRGFTPQRPLQRAFEQQPAAVQQWLHTMYPAIAARAKTEGDETAVSSIEHDPRGYAPKGRTPVLVLAQSKRERLNLISTITNQGTLRVMRYCETLTAKVLIQFLERLIRDSKRKVFLTLNNLRVHHRRPVKAWLEDHQDLIERFFLPSYALELNPDEYLNADLKARMHAAKPVRNGEHRQRKVRSHRHALQKQPSRIRSYFKAKPIRYAA